MRERTNLSQQNWLKEKDELLEQESYLQSEFEQAKEAMHNWEVLAMEERSVRESLGEKVIDLEEQLVGLKDAYEKAASERDSQTSTVDGLQRALQEIQSGMPLPLLFVCCGPIKLLITRTVQLENKNFVNSLRTLILSWKSCDRLTVMQKSLLLKPKNPCRLPWTS